MESNQLCSDKTATTLEDTTLLAYSKHFILLNVFAEIRESLLGNEHTVVCFLLVCFTQKGLEEEGPGRMKKFLCKDIYIR